MKEDYLLASRLRLSSRLLLFVFEEDTEVLNKDTIDPLREVTADSVCEP